LEVARSARTGVDELLCRLGPDVVHDDVEFRAKERSGDRAAHVADADDADGAAADGVAQYPPIGFAVRDGSTGVSMSQVVASMTHGRRAVSAIAVLSASVKPP